MSTVAQLERLRVLIERLAPLGAVQRGTLIRAQDWNEVIAVLIEVARATLAEGGVNAGVPPHDHPDQVKVSWLEPTLRALIERGPLSDPAAAGKLDELHRRATRFSDSISKFERDLTEIRTRIADVATRDLVRQSEITTVRRLVEAIDARGDDLQTMRAALNSIRKDVQTAMSLASRMQIDGQPVDIAVVDQRIRRVEELRERLQMPGGELLDGNRLEERLTGLTNTFVTQEQLDEALDGREATLPEGVLADLRSALQVDLRTETDGILQFRLGELRDEVNGRLGQIDGMISRAVADAGVSLRDETLAAIRPEIASSVRQAVQQSETATTTLITSSIDAVRADLARSAEEVRGSVEDLAATQIERQLGTALESVRSSLAALQQATTSLDQRLNVNQFQLGELSTRDALIERNANMAREELRRSLIAEMDTRGQNQTRTFERLIAEREQAINQRIDAATNDVRRGMTEQIRRAAAEAVAAESRILATRLRAEMVTIASDQVRALQNDLNTTINRSVTEAMRAVPGIVSQEVRLATANLSELVRTEVRAAEPSLRIIAREEARVVGAVPSPVILGPINR